MGNPHRAQISQLDLFELVLLLRLDKRFPVEQFEATVSQYAVPSPLLTLLIVILIIKVILRMRIIMIMMLIVIIILVMIIIVIMIIIPPPSQESFINVDRRVRNAAVPMGVAVDDVAQVVEDTYVRDYSCQGKILHTRNRKSESPLENATENPSDNSSTHPLGKLQSTRKEDLRPSSEGGMTRLETLIELKLFNSSSCELKFVNLIFASLSSC